MNFFNTFRGRLLLILAFMLVATLGVQYYLNLITQQENDDLRQLQAQALVAGIAVGSNSLTSNEDRVEDLVRRTDQTFLDEASKQRIADIIIIDNNWQIVDSLNVNYQPVAGEDGEAVYRKLADLTGLPPLMEGGRLGADLANFPNRKTADNKNADDEAHAVPIETSRGRWYIMVLLKNDKSEAARRAVLPLIVTLVVLSLSTLVTFLLVWRFTTPIANLSNAAREVAEGNLSIRVPETMRQDEMGRLAQRFNEMTAQLEKTRELETQLQQAEKSAVIGRLGSAIAHEIRNPLNYINLTLDHLRTKFAPEDAGKRETFEKLTLQLKAEVARINQQISDFLNYSRPANVNLSVINARNVVEDSLRIVEAQAAENDIKISIVEHENVPEVMGDPEFLRSVFNNLFINAVQAMGTEGGKLNVKISPDGSENVVMIEISDTGNGIPPENLAKIFEPYFSTKETGTGLGLAIVHKIVEIHNGTIEVESTVGEGTKFTVKLARAES
ncbi:MAG: HAMP domain-containing protein [Saprospiraceae bacterium]|nr:HAMP domain-containing protein [Pyrinomonadaceae bacterium]